MRFFITGGAGFVGSNLVDALLADGHSTVVYDNYSTGFPDIFLAGAHGNPNFRLVKGDILDRERLAEAMLGSQFVFHLAANADVRHGTQHPGYDLEQNTIGTFHVLEAMRRNGVGRIAFSSTGSIYGEPHVFPTPETCPFPVQTSLYGASKLAGEGLISSYCEGFGMQSYIFRFVSILGERYTHGHVYDFYAKLLANPREIHVLGNGKQRKSYLYVRDCIAAILTAISHPQAQDRVSIFNLGTDEYCEVDESLTWICRFLGLEPKRIYGGGERGWVGDSPFIFLDCSKIRSLGWRPQASIEEGVIKTLEYLQGNHEVIQSKRR